MPKRKRVPSDIEARVLEKSRRRCCLCWSLERDFKEKDGQIAHLDQDSSNFSESNLAFLCLPHHSRYDSTTSQHKNYTTEEVKRAKAALEAEIEKQEPLEWAIVLSGNVKEFNRPRVEAVAEHLRSLLEDPHLSITGVKRSSVRLDVSSAAATFARMQRKLELGEISEIFGHSIRRVAVSEDLDRERLVAARHAAPRSNTPSLQEVMRWLGPELVTTWALVDRFAREWRFDRLSKEAGMPAERGERMIAAVASLTVQERAILTLSAAGWTDEDIAAVLHLTLELLRDQRALAVARLRDRLSKGT